MLAITRQHWYNTERRKLMDDKKIQWHPPYVAAMNLEMRHDIDRFIFVPEYILNTGTLKIDLFIEDTGNIAPANEIGKIFKKYNVLEYKNPKDKLGIDVFVKVQSYAGLFKASGEKPDSRKMKSITVSYVCESKPEKLFKYLKKCGVSIEIPYKGIYYIYGSSIPFTTQIIVTKELDHEKHKWLCALSGRLEEQDLKDLLAGISSLDGKMEKEYADSVLEAALKANKRLAEKLRSDENMSKTLLEIMEPVLKEREETYTKYANGDLDSYAKSMGYKSKDEYIKEALLPDVKQELLRNKYIKENLDHLLSEYQVVRFKKIIVSKESTALAIISNSKDEKSFNEQMKKYSDKAEDAGIVTKNYSLDENLTKKILFILIIILLFKII